MKFSKSDTVASGKTVVIATITGDLDGDMRAIAAMIAAAKKPSLAEMFLRPSAARFSHALRKAAAEYSGMRVAGSSEADMNAEAKETGDE